MDHRRELVLVCRVQQLTIRRAMTKVSNLLASFPRASLMGDQPLWNGWKTCPNSWIWTSGSSVTTSPAKSRRQQDEAVGVLHRAARASQADTILITGAVQSNFARTAAVAAAKHGMHAILQREERVPDMDPLYYSSGNVFLSELMDADDMHYPVGEDEAGADAALAKRAETIRAEGRAPYIIPLGIDHPPLGALGYVSGGAELAGQCNDLTRRWCPLAAVPPMADF